MAPMTSEVCLAWFKFTEPTLAKILRGPKTSMNTPIPRHMLHTVTSTHHVSRKLTQAPQKPRGLQSPTVTVFVTQLRCPHTAPAQ